jgi:tRNA(fMet)-specific endonuclease VapC
MADFLLDTNHASRLMAGVEPLSSRVQQAQIAGDRIGLSIIVVGELYFAVYASVRRSSNMTRLRALTDALHVRPFNEAVAEEFGRIRAEQKAIGRPIPAPDVQIAATARLHGLILLTADRHFQYVAGLTVENWLI